MLEKAFAKINLGLDILGKRPDGYHEVNMIMQSIALADEVEILPAETLKVTTDRADLPGGKDNLAWKAVMLLAEKFGHKPNVQVYIRKKIFLAAGLAGGSADGAAVLRGLNSFWELGLDAAQLELLAAELGSDVPFCIRGGTAVATGRGDILEPLPDLPETWLVLAKPNFEVSTAWAYKNYLSDRSATRPRIADMKDAIARQDMSQVRACMGNVLEGVTACAHPQINTIKDIMKAQGAQISLMSGSGPTVFGLVESEEAGERLIKALRQVPDLEIELTKTLRRNET